MSSGVDANVASSSGVAGGTGTGNGNDDTPKQKCDICGFGRSRTKNKKQEKMKMVQCTKCKVYVHAECYGVPLLSDDVDFICLACDAVGKKFEAVELWKIPVRQGDREEEEEAEFNEDSNKHLCVNFNTEIVKVKQRTRPQECAFCSIRDGIHAMHPLFDNHGSRGRRIFKRREDNNKKELVWCHTLCASMLSCNGKFAI
jgi:PHD-finger